MIRDAAIAELESTLGCFKNTIECLSDQDSDFAPKSEMLTASEHIAHTAETVNWFVEGAFSPTAFDTDFANLWKKIEHIKTISQATAELEKNIANAVEQLQSSSDEDWLTPIADGQIMAGIPRIAIINGIIDHTAHHRGALAVYARLLGKEPKMPYA